MISKNANTQYKKSIHTFVEHSQTTTNTHNTRYISFESLRESSSVNLSDKGWLLLQSELKFAFETQKKIKRRQESEVAGISKSLFDRRNSYFKKLHLTKL